MIVPFELPLPLILEIGVTAGVYALIARRPKLQREHKPLPTKTAAPRIANASPALR